MKRLFPLLVSCVVVGCALALISLVSVAHALASDTISGTVVNATHTNAVVANQQVTLQRSAGSNTQDVATTMTDDKGHFAFENVAGSTSDTFAVYTQYQGGMFSSATTSLGTDAANALQLKVYDTTSDDAHLSVTVATILVRQPRPANGLIGLGEVISIQNSGSTAFVGTPTATASKPMQLLLFATPPNTSNLSLGLGFDGAQIITTDKGFGATATVPPGTTEFAFGIDVPYTGTTADVSYRATYPTVRVVMLISPDMSVNGRDFQAQGTVNSLGTQYQVYAAASTKPGTQVALQLTGLTRAGETSYLDANALTILAGVLALLALLLLAFYLRRGNIATALGWIPTARPDRDTMKAPATADESASEREDVLRELLALERAHAAGKLSDADFQRRDRELRLHARQLLASHLTDSGASTRIAPADADGKGLSQTPVPAEETASEQSSGGRL